MKLHDETAIAFSFIDLETEASLSLVSGVKVKERLNVRLQHDAMVTLSKIILALIFEANMLHQYYKYLDEI